MRSHRPVFPAALMALLLIVALPGYSGAQTDQRFELAAGYSAMRDYDGEATFPRGWFASVAVDVAGPVSLVGDMSGSYKSMDGLNIELSMNIHTFMGGPRLMWRASRVSPYVQTLFGVARFTTTYTLPEETLSDAKNHFAIAPGAGVDVRFSDRGAIRVGTNIRFIRAETFTPTGSESFMFKELQFIAGVVIR